MSQRNRNKRLSRLLLVDDDAPSPKSRRSSQGSKGKGKSPARAGTPNTKKSATRASSGGTQASPVPGTSQGGSQTQTSMSDFLKPGTSKKGKFNPLSPVEANELAGGFAYFILAGSNNKSPVSRLDIIKSLMPNQDPKHYPQIIAKTAEIMQDIFGLKLIPSDDRPLEKTDKILVINTIERKKSFLKLKNKDAIAHRTFLCLLLYCIHMSGGHISEEALLDYITDLKIVPSDHDNEAFGNIPKRLNTYKTQMYLKYTRPKNVETPTTMVEWGPRAHAECSKEHIMKFIKHLYPEYTLDDLSRLNIREGEEEESGSDAESEGNATKK